MLALLEPISTGDVIDRSVRLYRRNFGAFALIVAIPGLVSYASALMAGFGYLGAIRETDPVREMGQFAMAGIGYFFAYIVSPFLYLLAVAVLARASADHIMLGTPITFKGALKLLRGHFLQLVLAWVLLMAIMFATVLVCYMALIVMVIGAALLIQMARTAPTWVVGVTMGLAVAIGLGGLIVFLLAVMSRVCFLPQVMMIEGVDAGDAFRRSFKLGGRNWFRLGGILLFHYFVVISLLSAILVPISLYLYANQTLSGLDEWEMLSWFTLLYSTASQFSTILALPILVIAFTLLYFDNRVRKEAYDVELMIRQIEPVKKAPIGPAAAPEPEADPVSASEILYCMRCGQRVANADASFCAHCGTPIVPLSAVQAPPPEAPSP